jgi:hypothetical protein
MATVRNPFKHLVLALSIVVVLSALACATALLLPDSTLAQAGEPRWAKPDLQPTAVPPSPPPPLHLNPPSATPEPGAVKPSSGVEVGRSDLEVVRFRPDTVLRLGESLPVIAAEKPASAAGSDQLKRLPGEVVGPQEPYQAPDIAGLLSPLDWTVLAYEGFVGFSPPAVGTPFAPAFGSSSWVVYDFPHPTLGDDGYERTWGANDWISYYHADDPSDIWSAWPAAFGNDALDPNLSFYTNTLNSWMVYGPIDLSEMTDVFVSFGLWYQTEPDFDQVFFGASTDGNMFYGDFWSGDSGGWTDQAYYLTSYAGYSEVWLAWFFQSDGSVFDDGPFVDEIWVWGDDPSVTPTPTPTPDPSGELIQNGSFETGDLTNWQTDAFSVSSNPIQNSDFENGPDGSWTEYSTHGWDLIINESGPLPFPGSVTPHSGSWAVWLGGEDDEISYITQTVTIPSSDPVLVFRYWIASGDDVCAIDSDLGGVLVDTTVTDVVDAFYLCASTNTGGWVIRMVDLSAYAGQTVQLRIQAETDSSLNSNLFVDDVVLASSTAMSGRQTRAARPAASIEGMTASGSGDPTERKGGSQRSRDTERQDGSIPDGPALRDHSLRAGSELSTAVLGPSLSLGGSEHLLDSAPSAATPGDPAQESTNSRLQDASEAEALLGVADVGVSDATYVEGQYAAYLWRSGGFGIDYLYQTISVPSDVTDVVLNFWFAVTTYETYAGYDWFCAGMVNPANHGEIWVDLGCVDASDASGYWQEVIYTLDSTEVAAIAGQSVDLVFEQWSDVDFYGDGAVGSGGTSSWVDYVRLYATGSGAGSFVDPNEPNDDTSEATAVGCGDTITGTIGDALGGDDIDWFVLSNVPTGRIDVDIDADTKLPPSALDSVVGLWDSSPSLVAWNDDDGASYDSYVVYTNTTDNATFYVSVESYSGYGSPDSFYDLTVQCAGSGTGPPAPSTEPDPPDDTWTVMLYLNAEDPNFESILTKYRTDIEAFIGGKTGFLTVTILYDGTANGTGPSGTTRYVVQPNGNYTPGTNEWDRGELNMGHPDTLANFVTWSMDQYPADHYYLAVDDHGDGVYGISTDSTSNNDQLTPPDLYSALKSATHNGNRRIDIFDFEACLMGLAENAYDLREWVDFVVFFQQISWGIDTYPVYFGDLSATDVPLDVGRRIVDRYYAQATAEGYPHTISLIDTSHMEDVMIAVTSFGDTIRATDTLDQRNDVTSARDNSQAFAADIDATNPIRAEYIDLWDLADHASSLASAQATAVKSAVDAAVVHERHASGGVSGYIWDHSGVHGLSIYYPTTQSSSAFGEYPNRYQMSQDGGWDEFLAWALPTGIGRGMTSHRAEIRLTGGDTFVYRYVYLPAVLR